MYLQYRACCRAGKVCFVVYAKASSAVAAQKIFTNPKMYGEFMRMKTYLVPLAKYTKLISDALLGVLAIFFRNIKTLILISTLADSPEKLKMHTACKIDPVYRRSTRKTYGYVAPNLGILARVAPPVPGDAMNRLFGPRTFTQLQGKKGDALSLSTGQQPPYAAEGFFGYSDDLAPPYDPWPMVKQPRNKDVERMKSQITDSLLRGANETILSPSIRELTSPEFYDPGESSVASVLRSLYMMTCSLGVSQNQSS